MYVPHLMLLNEGPVTMTTMKLNVQFDAVLNAFAGARMRRPTISAGCIAFKNIYQLICAGEHREGART